MPSFDPEHVRHMLRQKTVYLGDSNAVPKLAWLRTLDFDRVVLAEDKVAYLEALRNRNNSDEEPPVPEAANSLCNWKPSQLETNGIKFADIRPNAIAGKPMGVAELESDFLTGQENIDQLAQLIVPDDELRLSSTGMLDSSTYPADGFRISHKMFELRKAASAAGSRGLNSNESNDEDDESEEDEPDFMIENWPVVHEEARAELQKIISTHIAKPIPAYSISGAVIPPAQYAEKLCGVIGRLEFNMNHRVINGKHNFTADIKRLKVLGTSLPRVRATPTRKRIAKRDDFEDTEGEDAMIMGTPTKKQRSLQ